MTDPDQKTEPATADGTPKFGRLLIVLACAVILVVLVTVASQAYYQ